jgi:hypothetical protein
MISRNQAGAHDVFVIGIVSLVIGAVVLVFTLAAVGSSETSTGTSSRPASS